MLCFCCWVYCSLAWILTTCSGICTSRKMGDLHNGLDLVSFWGSWNGCQLVTRAFMKVAGWGIWPWTPGNFSNCVAIVVTALVVEKRWKFKKIDSDVPRNWKHPYPMVSIVAQKLAEISAVYFGGPKCTKHRLLTMGQAYCCWRPGYSDGGCENCSVWSCRCVVHWTSFWGCI